MKISNKELFNNLVKEVLSNKLKLTEDYVEKYDITDKYFWERNKKDNPINNNCGRNIVKMYEAIIDYNENCNRISDEKSSEKEKYSIDKQRYEKLVEGIEKYFCVSKADDSQIIEIVKIILSKIEDENEIDYVDLLWDIKKSLKNKIEFNKKGKILLDEVEAKYNLTVALVLILLDRVPSNNKFALQILEKYCKDEFGIYSDIIFKMDFGINITQNLKWFYTMRKFIEDDGTANGKYIRLRKRI